MQMIVRYKNGTLYAKPQRKWLSLADIFQMPPTSYQVIENRTKEDITAEVAFLARVDYVKREKLWKWATVVISPFKAE